MRKTFPLLLAAALLAALPACKHKEAVTPTSVMLSPATLTLVEGETQKLTATVQPKDAEYDGVVWSSSVPDIATVNQDGQVTAVKVGYATITAKAGNVSGTCKVTVNAAPPQTISVTSVALSPSVLSLEEGETATLTATVAPDNATNKDIAWASADEKVAKVKDGVVTAIAPGETTVTVTTVDGGKTASCQVTVTAAPPQTIAVTGVTVSMSFVELTEGDEPYQLTATVQPEDATNKEVTWASADESVATVKDGLVTPVAPGETTITVTTVDGGKTDKCTVSVVAKEVPATGVTVDPASIEIMEGETYQLKAIVNPEGADQTVEWVSQHNSIATIDQNGLVTAVSPGDTRIYARSAAYPEMMGYCDVTVAQDGTLKGISLDASEIQLQVGKSRVLSVIYHPEYAANKTVSWASSAPSVAKVTDEGTVFALQEGTAIITATSEEGGFTASCNVTVSQAEGPFIYYLRYGSLYVNGEKDPLTSMYDVDDWNYYNNTAYIDSDGKDLYSVIGFGYHTWFAKNHKPLIDVEDLLPPYPQMLSARNGVFAVLGNIGDDTFKILRATEAGDVKTIEVAPPAKQIYDVGIAVAPDGTIYAAVRMQDVFYVKDVYYFTIKPDGSYTEKPLNTDYAYDPHIAISDEGDVYVFGGKYDEEYKQVGGLYKNGELEKTIDRVDYGFQGGVACQGGHVYTAMGDLVNKEIRIHKDGETIYTIQDESGAFISYNLNIRALSVTANGDVYLSWVNGDGVHFLSKNGQPLYTSTEHSFDTFCIVE